MDKNEFISFLNNKLFYLVDSERNKEIEKCSSVIDNYISMGQTQEDAIASLGNPDDLVYAIYLSHGLDYKKISTGKVTAKGFLGALKNFYSLLTNKDRKKAGGALLYFIYLIVLIILLKIVFIFVRDIGLQIFNDISNNRIIDKFYTICFDVIYVASAILLFIKLFTKRFK